MKNIYKILLSMIIFLPLCTSCEDWLEQKDSTASLLSEDDMFSDPIKIERIAFRLYDAFGWWLDGVYDNGDRKYNPGVSETQITIKDYANTGVISGEIMSYRDLTTIQHLVPGNYQQMVDNFSGYQTDFGVTWASCWEVVYVANLLLDKIPNVSSSILTQEQKNQYLGEAHAFRAFAYYELFRRWGDIPYFGERMYATSNFDIPKTKVADIAQKCSDDCDKAATYFSRANYGVVDGVLAGRIAKAAPVSLKSLVWTTAASPLFNPNNDLKLWENAANAALDAIKLSEEFPGEMGLQDCTSDKTMYNEIFRESEITVEACWPRWYSQRQWGAWGGNWLWARKNGETQNVYMVAYSPTQEMVDMFEMNDGLAYDHPNSKYQEQNPYANRDPRFYTNIWYHGSKAVKNGKGEETVDMLANKAKNDMWETWGVHDGNSCTGYLVRKLQPVFSNNAAYKNYGHYSNAPRIRMAEMYLNYAEAVNEWKKDPNATCDGSTLSAVGAINKVRARIGMCGVNSVYTGDYKVFRERVRNEFGVELCFERHRLFDLMRWKTGVEYINKAGNFHGMNVTGSVSNPVYTRKELAPLPRVYEEKHYLYPFPTSEVKMSSNLTQNPGW